MQVVPGAVKLAPRPHCRALQPGEFNGIIPSPLPVYSESFIEFHASVSCNVADRHSYKVTNACDQNNTSTAVDRWRYKFFAVLAKWRWFGPFCRAMLCISATCAVARYPSVRPSVCPSVTFVYSVEISKHLQTFIRRLEPHHCSFSIPNVMAVIQTATS